MSYRERTWRLLRGELLVGEVEVDGSDFPWLNGRFVAGPGYAAVRPWFDESLAALEAEEFERFEDAYAPIGRELTLVAPDAGPVAEFLLHIEGGRAWFRWSDEAFDGE
ncbi:hypothetical protein [Kitasatospora sp. NBC_01266]|uniref:hypothetical protein n=1 Tax=Kitasatospora sp. NBC_01266 TaxID=2903572 RepID=UPI002E338F0D|nr:hypothetical protein [Kitasatospora sp. NBC_01266]